MNAARPTAQMRLIGAQVLLTLAFVVSLAFQGTQTNLLVLASSVALLLVALTCAGPKRIVESAASHPLAALFVAATLAYLVLCYRLSLSPDNSFAASWVLAAVPLTFLCTNAIDADRIARRWVLLAPLTVVLALASMSSLRFVAFGERAQWPLVDPNNYATLMYLAWIPMVHRHLVRIWSGRSPSTAAEFGALIASFVLVLAIVATRSRTALLIVIGCLVFWSALAIMRRMRPVAVWRHWVVVIAAWCVGFVINHLTEAAAKGLQFDGGLAIREALVRSAIAIWTDHPLGIGVFCFPLMYPSVRSLSEQDTAGLFVHNDYVQFLVEGGVPLLLLLIAFVVVVIRRSVQLARLNVEDQRYSDLGFGVAIVAASSHALVNFVYYSLPLDFIVGIFAARLFGVGTVASATVVQSRTPARLAMAGLAAGWLIWGYLALDVAVVGVFQGQPTFGLTDAIRSDPKRMLAFARNAQALNGNRGIPVFGEAVLLFRAAEAEPSSRYLSEGANHAFQRAIAVDPWNTLTYVRFAEFLREFPGVGATRSTDELLLSAIAIDPTFSPAIDELVDRYQANGEPLKAYQLLRTVVYPWMRVLRRNDPESCERYLRALQAYASATEDDAFLKDLDARRVELRAIQPRA